MKKLLSYAIAPLLVAALFFVAGFDIAHAQTESPTSATQAAVSFLGGTFDVVGTVLAPVGYAIMTLASKITMLAGVALNATIYYTVVKMAQTFADVPAIDGAWRVVRDLANMGFIFVLLYASIMTIVGSRENDARGLIVKMVIAAILINFSLFFTKVVIDVANLLALTFYSSMAPVATLTENTFMSAGVSNAMMDALHINSLWQNRELLTGSNLFIITILSSVVLLIAAFVFFAVAIMFMIRYVVLIFVLILSPIAFVSGVLPGLDSIAKQWKEALIGQAFFAPIYFLLTWVTLFLAKGLTEKTFISTGGLGTALAGAQSNAIPTLINYAVIIIFLIASLIIAKKYADMAPGGVQKLTKWAMGAAGGATFGLAGRFARGTVGRAAQAISEREDLKNTAAKSGIGGAMARLGLAASRKTAGAGLDLRATGLGNTLDAGKAQEGGFAKDMKNRIENEKKFAESLKPSELVTSRAEKGLEEAKKTGTLDDIENAQAEVDRLKGVDENEARNRKLKDLLVANPTWNKKQAQKEMDRLEDERMREVERLKAGGMSGENADKDAERRNIGWKPKKIKGVGTERQETRAKDLEEAKLFGRGNRYVGYDTTKRIGFFGPVKREYLNSAIEIRKKLKEKKPADRLAEELAKAKESGADEGEPTPAPGTTPAGSASTAGGASSGGTSSPSPSGPAPTTS